MSAFDLFELLVTKVYVFVAIGALLAAVGVYSTARIQWIIKQLVVNTLLPLLIAEKVLGHLNLADVNGVLFAFAGGVSMILLSAVLVRLLLPWLGGTSENLSSLMLGNTFHNYSFIPFPLALALLGEKALSFAFVFALACDGLFWSFGVFLIQHKPGQPGRIRWSKVITPPFVVMLLSLGLAFSGVNAFIPKVVYKYSSYLTQITIPLAISTIGGVFYHSFKNISWNELQLPAIFKSLALRQLILPAFWALLFYFVMPSDLVRKVAVIEAIMPASIGVVLLGALYGGDSHFLVSFSTVSNLVSILSVPLYLHLASILVGGF